MVNLTKILRVLGFILLCPTLVWANPYNWPVNRMVDGDTIVFDVNWLPPELGTTISVRVLGIDTPESKGRAKCPKEAALSEQAKAFVKVKLADAKEVTVFIKQWDKFGGRIDGEIFIDGISLGQLLIDQKYARPYWGEKKQSWCE